MWYVWGEEMGLQGFGGETYGKENTFKNRIRWVDNIKTEFYEIILGECGMD